MGNSRSNTGVTTYGNNVFSVTSPVTSVRIQYRHNSSAALVANTTPYLKQVATSTARVEAAPARHLTQPCRPAYVLQGESLDVKRRTLDSGDCKHGTLDPGDCKHGTLDTDDCKHRTLDLDDCKCRIIVSSSVCRVVCV